MCNLVTEAEIVAVLKIGARTTSEIQKLTAAGTSCGRCLVVLDSIVEDFVTKQPEDQQQKLNF